MTEAQVKRRKAERPTEILAAALQEFSAKGYAATRLDDVAARAGITKGTIYVYFPGKEDLFIATLAEKSKPLIEHLRVLVADADLSALEILTRHLRFAMAHMVEDACNRDIFRILLGEGHRFPQVVDRWHAEVLEPAMVAIKDVLRRGVERGEFRDTPALDYPQLIIAPIILCNTWQSLFGERRPLATPAFFEAAVDLLTSGLLRR